MIRPPILLAMLLLPVLFRSTAGADRPNVLFIVSDDLNCDLGCYGHPMVESPHIDRLAERGVRFERAYCQYPVCNPSRSSFMTGLYPEQTGVLSNAGDFRKQWPELVTLPQLFRQHGYFAARVGKIYHYGVPTQIGTDGADDPESWQEVVNPRGRDKDDEPLIKSIAPHRNFGGTLSWLSADGTDDEQTDAIGAEAGIRLLEEHRDGPFFIAVGFYRPHTPYVAPHAYFRRYPLETIRLVDEPEDDLDDIPYVAWVDRPYQQDMTEHTQKEVLQAYYASITFMDQQVGRLLDAVDRLGLAENTIIVFTSDHGYHMGEHRLWQKSSLFENSARVPLIIAAPGKAGNGRASAATAELLDLYPTLAELCDLPAPEHLAGESVAAVLDDPSRPGKEAALTVVNSRRRPPGYRGRGGVLGRSIRTDRWRYTEWGRDARHGVELYDHQSDPGEFINLAESPGHAATVAELSRLLDQTQARAGSQ